MAIYNKIGKTYNTTRRADTRIVQRLILELDVDAPATILDIGAGTGNYSYELAKIGYRVIALEPSEVMRTQGKQHRNVIWKEGVAESLPLEDKSVDGVICTLASHHFKNLSLCFSEMKRVLKENGRIVIFTLDPRMCATDCWLLDYFKPLLEDAYKIHPPIKVISQMVEAQITQPVKIKAYPLPYDLVDHFFFSGWRKPELYFNKDFQEGTSPLAKGHKEVVYECLNRLNTDLENGDWYEKYGDILKLTEYECGHFFLII